MGGMLSCVRNQEQEQEQEVHHVVPQVDLAQVFPGFDVANEDLNWAQRTARDIRTQAAMQDVPDKYSHVMNGLELGEDPDNDAWTGYQACHESSSITAQLLARENIALGGHSSTHHLREDGFMAPDHAYQVITENQIDGGQIFRDRGELIQNDNAVIVDGTWKQMFSDAPAEALNQVDDLFVGTRSELQALGGQLGYDGDALTSAMRWWGDGLRLGDPADRVDPPANLNQAFHDADAAFD